MIVRGSWPYDGGGDDSRPDPRQAGVLVLALAFGFFWAAVMVAGLVVLVLKLLV